MMHPQQDGSGGFADIHVNLADLDILSVRPGRTLSRDESNRASVEQRKLWVSGFMAHTTENQLYQVFSKVAKVVDAVVPRDKATKRPKNFGFITFETKADADRVGNTNFFVDGRRLAVKLAEPRPGVNQRGRDEGFGNRGDSSMGRRNRDDWDRGYEDNRRGTRRARSRSPLNDDRQQHRRHQQQQPQHSMHAQQQQQPQQAQQQQQQLSQAAPPPVQSNQSDYLEQMYGHIRGIPQVEEREEPIPQQVPQQQQQPQHLSAATYGSRSASSIPEPRSYQSSYGDNGSRGSSFNDEPGRGGHRVDASYSQQRFEGHVADTPTNTRTAQGHATAGPQSYGGSMHQSAYNTSDPGHRQPPAQRQYATQHGAPASQSRVPASSQYEARPPTSSSYYQQSQPAYGDERQTASSSQYSRYSSQAQAPALPPLPGQQHSSGVAVNAPTGSNAQPYSHSSPSETYGQRHHRQQQQQQRPSYGGYGQQRHHRQQQNTYNNNY